MASRNNCFTCPFPMDFLSTDLAVSPWMFHGRRIPASPTPPMDAFTPSPFRSFALSLHSQHNPSGDSVLMTASADRWSMGSLLFLASWAVLMGPVQYLQHLLSGPRLPFTAAYLGSIVLTLLFAIKVGRSPQFIPIVESRYPVSSVMMTCPPPGLGGAMLGSGPKGKRSEWSADGGVHMTASQYLLDLALLDFPVSRAGVVPCQLFSHGKYRSTLCRPIWK